MISQQIRLLKTNLSKLVVPLNGFLNQLNSPRNLIDLLKITRFNRWGLYTWGLYTVRYIIWTNFASTITAESVAIVGSGRHRHRVVSKS